MDEIYRIAVCDDDREQLDKMEEMLAVYAQQHPQVEFKTDLFSDSRKLVNMVEEKAYLPDLMLLDIYMPEKTGIEAAQELRELGSDCRIVLITASEDHALEAFGVGASQYLLKPVSEQTLFPVLDSLLEEWGRRKKKYFLFRSEGKISKVSADRIVCCEAQGKRQRLYFTDGLHAVINSTMAEVYEKLSVCPEFVKVGGTYIVNLEHVDSMNAREAILDIGRSIYLPRGTYQMLRERYFRYYCEEM